MRVLISVQNAEEAGAALAGGADIIDAKDPSTGALGAVTLPALSHIVTAVGGARLVTAALGDASDDISIARMAETYARAGAGLVKVGFSGISSRATVTARLIATRHGAGARAGVIAAGYADADRVASVDPFAMIDAAADAGVAGVLLDTAHKHGPGLCQLMPLDILRTWVAAAHDAGLLAALAGKLTLDDLSIASDAGADIVGVRGAVCEQGRASRVVTARVRQLMSAVDRRSARAPAPARVSAYE